MLRIWSFRGSYGTLGNGMQQASNRGPRASPAEWVAWGEGGDPEHSRRKPGSYETGFSEPCGGISDVVPLTGLEPVRYRYRRILSDRAKAEAGGTWRPLEVAGEDGKPVFSRKNALKTVKKLCCAYCYGPSPLSERKIGNRRSFRGRQPNQQPKKTPRRSQNLTHAAQTCQILCRRKTPKENRS